MRKLTKILAIVMIACLLCGVIATSAFATLKVDSKTNFLDASTKGTGITAHKYLDFNDKTVSGAKNYTLKVDSENNGRVIGGYGNIEKAVDEQILGGTTDGDNYFKFFLDSKLYTTGESGRFTAATDRVLSNPQFWIDVNDAEMSAGGALADFETKSFLADGTGLKYQVVDFDFAATEYIFTFGEVQTIADKILVDEAGKEYVVVRDAIVTKLGDAAYTYVTKVDEEYRHYITDSSVYTLSYFRKGSHDTHFQPRFNSVTATGARGSAHNASTNNRNSAAGKYPKVVYHENKWQLNVGEVYTPLSQTAGEWNHITMIVAFKSAKAVSGSTDGSITLTYYYFLNGVFVSSADETFKLISNDVGLTLVRLHQTMYFADVAIPGDKMSSTTATTEAPYFGHAFDNIAITSYGSAYTATADGTLGAYMTNEDYLDVDDSGNYTNPIFNCTDVVFSNTSYQSPNEISITETVSEDGNDVTLAPVTFSMPKQMLEAVKFNNNTIALEVKTPYAILNYTPDSSITGLTIYAPKVTLSEAAQKSGYTVNEEEAGKWILKKSSTFARFEFFLDEEKTQSLGVVTIYKGGNPAEYIPVGYDMPVVNDGKYYNLNWTYTTRAGEMDFLELGDNDIVSLAIPSLANPIPVILTPAEEPIVVTGYAIEKDGKLLSYSNTASEGEILDAVKNASNGSTIVLYSDVNITTNSAGIVIASGQQINFDTNGRDIFHLYTYTGTANTYAQCIFKITGGDNADSPTILNLYSSEAGSELYCVSKNANSTYPTSFNLFSAPGNYYNINIGKEGTEDDGNLSFFAGTLISAGADVCKISDNCNDGCTDYATWVKKHGEAETAIPDSINVPDKNAGTRVLNIDGCNINCVMQYSTALIPIRATDLKISINKSKIYSHMGNIITHDTARFAEADITITGSEIVAAKYDNSANTYVVNNIPKHVNVVFEGCTVYGNIILGTAANNNGSVTLKGTNYIGGTSLSSARLNYSEGTTTGKFTAEKSVELTLPQISSITATGYLAYDPIDSIKTMVGKTFTFKPSIATSYEEGGEIVNVIWKKKDGTPLKKDKYFIGETVTHPNDAASMTVYLKNGWYDLCYSGWVDENNPENKDVVMANTVFVYDEGTASPIVNVKGIQYNYELYGNFNGFIYSPVVYDEENKPTGVTVDGKEIPTEVTYLGFVTSEGISTTESTSYITLGDGSRLLRWKSGSITPIDFNTVEAYIGFKIEGYGDAVFTQKVTIDFAKYAESILADSRYGCGSEEGLLALSLLNYVNNNAIFANGKELATAVEVMNKHTNCECKTAGEALYNANKPSDNDILDSDYNHLNDYGVYSVRYTASINQPTICVYIPLDKLYIPGDSYNGAYNKTEHSNLIAQVVFEYEYIADYSAENGGNLVYKNETVTLKTADISWDSETSNIRPITVKVDGVDTQMILFRPTGIRAYNADAKFTITLKDNEGNVLTTIEDSKEPVGKYSLAEYVNYLTSKVENETDATAKAEYVKALNAAKGLYFYAQAAKDYKIISNEEQNPNNNQQETPVE